ncbi:MAG: hypothetical protein KBG48_00480 [Kofleriaceae bacterium]|jgi:DNA/RNA-binding domain of Phe-tRNA-synthetase-like protein|nr:hypothetical protein [Kofleriaceae bacterium]MBP9165819.1 hypothetical protein [Kofleriaceae bacterium]MBP9857968.1 hypothetical protein [Kofleriaceae bacterium]
MSLALAIAPHPLLEVGAFVTHLPGPLGEVSGPSWPAADGWTVDDAVRAEVRALLRHGGYKPSGRGKPASEYLAAAHAEGRFPAINPIVDLCNHVSLATGLPISVVDVDLGAAPWSIAVCPPGTTYVFNPAGQTIDASGLLALHDAAGPCGTPVKDAQRTKTSATTRAALAIVWGTRALPGRTARAVAWYRSLAAALGTIEDVAAA